MNLKSVKLCRLSGKRATSGCEAAGTAYVDLVPADLLPASNDLCPIHPARAVPVLEEEAPPARAQVPPQESEKILRAKPVLEEEEAPRAIQVEEPPPRALPVEETQEDFSENE